MNNKEMEFSVFCIENVADYLHMKGIVSLLNFKYTNPKQGFSGVIQSKIALRMRQRLQAGSGLAK